MTKFAFTQLGLKRRLERTSAVSALHLFATMSVRAPSAGLGQELPHANARSGVFGLLVKRDGRSRPPSAIRQPQGGASGCLSSSLL